MAWLCDHLPVITAGLGQIQATAGPGTLIIPELGHSSEAPPIRYVDEARSGGTDLSVDHGRHT